MRLDDQLKREGRMLYLGGENAGVPESHYEQIPWSELAARVLKNEAKRMREANAHQKGNPGKFNPSQLRAKRQTSPDPRKSA